jgi:4-amino-4-deoxy-L-arabinose transferase-like glycosyltransferase
VIVASLLANTALVLATGGLRFGADSDGYVQAAQALLHGDPFAGRPGGWLTLKVVIAASLLLTGGLVGVVLVNLAVACAAGAAQYQLTAGLGGSRAGLIGAALLIADLDIARFNAYILTDSLYTSLVILSAWSIARAADARPGRPHLLAIALTLAAALTRPNGALLPPIAVLYWLGPHVPNRLWWIAIACLTIAVGVGALMLPPVADVVRFEQIGAYLRSGQLVSDMRAWVLRMPSEPADVPVAVYVARHPLEYLQLALGRVGAELLHARPIYSPRHNALVLILAPLYVFAIRGFWRLRSQRSATLLAVIVGVQMATVAVTGADWDGRYLLFVLPLISVLAAQGLSIGWSASQRRPKPTERARKVRALG